MNTITAAEWPVLHNMSPRLLATIPDPANRGIIYANAISVHVDWPIKNVYTVCHKLKDARDGVVEVMDPHTQYSVFPCFAARDDALDIGQLRVRCDGPGFVPSDRLPRPGEVVSIGWWYRPEHDMYDAEGQLIAKRLSLQYTEVEARRLDRDDTIGGYERHAFQMPPGLLDVICGATVKDPATNRLYGLVNMAIFTPDGTVDKALMTGIGDIISIGRDGQ